MFARISILLLAGVLMAACQTAYVDQTQAIHNLIGGGLSDTEVFTPPYATFARSDGAYCESYQIRQFNRAGQIRYGQATVCQFQNGPWSLADRSFGSWSPASVPAPSYPAPSPSYPAPSHPVPNPSYPVPSHPHPNYPTPPASGQPGQWTPVTR